MNTLEKRLSGVAIALAAIQLFVGLMGVAGGIPMILEPSGAITGFQTEMLARSPFQDYLIPGLFLLFVNGLGSVAAGILTLLRHRLSGDLALAFGAFLLAWIVIQVLWIGLVNWMQPFFFALAVAELCLGYVLRPSMPPKPRF